MIIRGTCTQTISKMTEHLDHAYEVFKFLAGKFARQKSPLDYEIEFWEMCRTRHRIGDDAEIWIRKYDKLLADAKTAGVEFDVENRMWAFLLHFSDAFPDWYEGMKQRVRESDRQKGPSLVGCKRDILKMAQ